MKKSRTEKIATNVVFNILVEVIKLACGLILPRLILSNYGSEYNGLVQSVSQFLTCISLMKMGIGSATKAALFKPLAEKNDDEINEVLASTEAFMRKVSYIFVGFVIVFACIYPLWVEEFDWFFSASLIVVVSISTFAEYYFGFTYQMLLISDQREYIYSILSIITTIINTLVSIVLVNGMFSIHIVKLGSSLANVITPVFLYIYCHKHYHLKKLDHKPQPLAQRWDAFAHEIASFVNDYTDVMILTIFANLLEVSVYTVYHYVTVNLKKIVTSFVTSFGSAFGDMYARNENEQMEKNLEIYELIVYSFVSVLYSTALAMIIPFALLYTKGVTDINYERLDFACVAIVASAFDCFRYPYKSIINCTGHFKNTKKIAICESIINICVSVTCVICFGLIGVSIGTLCTMAFGACLYSLYLSKNVIKRNPIKQYKHMFISLLTIAVVYFISRIYMGNINSYFVWLIYASITGIIALAITVIIDYILYKDSFVEAVNKILRTIGKKLKINVKRING